MSLIPNVCVSDYARILTGNAFRLVVKSDSYVANLDYGNHEMAEQEHEIWVDGSVYSLDKFKEDMASKIIWGSSQTLVVRGVDSGSGSEWKLTSNEQFKPMIESRWDEKVMHIAVEVVAKDGYEGLEQPPRHGPM